MAHNTNQHFVPRTHLKPFTLDGAGAAINLFNIKRMEAITNAPVKHQCSKDNFYGRDEKLERAIQFIEQPYGSVVNHLARDGIVLPGIEMALRRFAYHQHLRTEAASQASAMMTLALTDLPGSDFPVPTLGEAMKIATQMAMLHFTQTMGAVDDLELCIVRNATDVPFVTSDNPAVLTSRLHLDRILSNRRSFGVTAAGAVITLPLTPSLLLILYDRDTYMIPQSDQMVSVASAGDIDALNEHQYLNCAANIYFGAWDERARVAGVAAAAKSRRVIQTYNRTHAVLERADADGEDFRIEPVSDIRDGRKRLVHITANRPQPSAWPSFLLFRNDASAWANANGRGLTRRGCLDRGYIAREGYSLINV